ncbi:MAG: TonB-dependent receptor plug [Mucilaginibacter sp.]|nr:TonB-dependent receptor plug [Mucilaginibacter sp.]
MKKLKYLFIICFLFPLSLLAQQTSTGGKVIDFTDGSALPGVSVKIKGTTTGTVTDKDGKFRLNIAGPDTYLQLSYLGYVAQEIQVKDLKDGIIALKSTNKSLEEVVVVGYGTQKRANLSSAVSTVSNKELIATKNENVYNMLSGKIPGLAIQQRSSEPGGFDAKIDLRGFGQPLIVIDGVPGGDLSRLDPNEIDNISVVKDASAAVYGVRAANGVIIVTTKKGGKSKNGKFNFSYSVNNAWQQFLNVPNSVGALDYMMLKNEQQKRDFNSNYFTQSAPAFSAADMKPYQDGTLKTSNWGDEVFNKTASQIQHNLSMNGGNDKVDYFFNFGYQKQDGLYKSGDLNYDKYNFRSNVTVRITDRLRAQALISGNTDTKNQPAAPLWTIFKYTWNQLPTSQIYANNNTNYLHVEPDNANPVGLTNSKYGGFGVIGNKNFQGQLSLEYDIPGISGLQARGMFNYDYGMNDNRYVTNSYTLYNYDTEKQVYLPTVINSPSNTTRQFLERTKTLSQLSLNYNKSIDGHNINALILYEESNQNADNFSGYRELSLPVNYLFAGNSTNQTVGQNTDFNNLGQIVTKGIVGKVNYDYKGKYLAGFSFRRDGSSKFNPNVGQWGFFPAGSLGWRISEESFFKSLISPEAVNNLKIRATYGKTGDDSATAFQYLSGYNYPAPESANNPTTGGYIFGGSYTNGISARPYANPNLTWTTSKTLDVGLDLDMWRGLLGVSADYYVRNRTGLPATEATAIPGTVGIQLPQENLNSDRTKGVELVLTHRNRIGEVGYNISAQISANRTMNVAVQQTRAGNSYENWKNSKANRYTNIWWGKTYSGQFQNYNQIYNYGINTGGGNNNVIPGDYYYQDWNGDGVIDSKDEHPIATMNLPLINYGVTIGVNYKGFDMSMLLQGAAHVYVQYAEQLATPLMYNGSALTQFLNRWHTTDPTASVFDPNAAFTPGYYPAMGSPIAEGTKAIQNASYLRIKSLEFGYTISKNALKSIGISSCRIYINSYNLATFTGLKGADPEHPGIEYNSDGSQNFDAFVGGYKYPLNRTFNIGANITF